MKATTPWTKAAILAALAIFPVAANAQGGPPRGHRPPPSPLIEALDADKDHSISAEEIKGAVAALKALDTDGDGKLSKEELRPKPPEGAPADDKDHQDKDKGKDRKGGGGGPPPKPPGEDDDKKSERPKPPKNPVMVALDTDGDGELSADEIAKAAESLAKLDKDGDGAISEKEFRPEPPKDGKPPRER